MVQVEVAHPRDHPDVLQYRYSKGICPQAYKVSRPSFCTLLGCTNAPAQATRRAQPFALPCSWMLGERQRPRCHPRLANSSARLTTTPTRITS